MKVTRVGFEKDIDKVANPIDVVLSNGQRFRLTEEHGQLCVHANDGKISIYPGCADEIAIESDERFD